MSANTFRKDIDELMELCDAVCGVGECNACPLYHNCLKDNSVEDIWNKVSAKRIDDFINFADQFIEEEEEELTREDEYINANESMWKELYCAEKYGDEI